MIGMIQNLRIGTKLGIASALSILLVGLMIYAQMSGNWAVKRANQTATEQQTIALTAAEAKAAQRGMQIGVRDMRLANSPESFKAANEYLAARVTRANGLADASWQLSHSPENGGRMEKLKGGIGEYAKGAQQIATIKTEIIGIESKRVAGSELPAEAVAKISKLNDEAIRVAREVTLPIASEIEALANKIVESAKSSADEANAIAAKDMASAELLSLSIGLSAALLLIASCVFSIFSIARPMRALSLS